MGANNTALRGIVTKQNVPLFRQTSRRWRSTQGGESMQESATASLSPRWLSDIKQRIGRCILFGLKPHQTDHAGNILQEIARDWRELVAGSEGFLTGPKRRSMHRQEVVWGEMDSMGHVNNVMYNRYAESGRTMWAQKYARLTDPAHRQFWSELLTPKGDGLLLRSIKTEFKFPMKWPDHISIYHKLRDEPTDGTDTIILDVLIVSELHQRPAARCIEDMVVYSYPKAKKTPLQSFMVQTFRETFRLQEEAKKRNIERVRSISDRTRALEKDTWDNEGAAEDLGSATD